MKIRIGTRTSRMAMAQAKTVARLLKEKYPDMETRLVGIVPSGDRDKTTPLDQMNTVGIFSKEIDDYLLIGEIDIAVHSLKDLGTQRPHGIARAALLEREDPHDIILFHPDILNRLKAGKKLVIGTSAPRRAELLPGFLKQALPQTGASIDIDLISIRGNANTRILKLLDPGQNFDAVVLALAGLNRLYMDSDAHQEITGLVKGLRRMIVPLTACPPAPGQGTICIEALQKRSEILDLLKPFSDQAAEKSVDEEYEILKKNGGGCHQRFGALSLKIPNIKDNVLLVRGKNKDGKDISETRWTTPAWTGQKNLWNGHDADGIFSYEKIPYPAITGTAAFAAHSRAVPENFPHDKTIWVSGLQSWYKLAARGYWIEGCADNFGFEFIKPTLGVPFLQLPALKDWDILSHSGAETTWKEGRFISTYSLNPLPVPAKTLETLGQADIFWWASVSQFEALKDHLPQKQISHACGSGKTAEILLAQGVAPLYVFPDIHACRKWIDDNAQKQHNPSS